MERIKADQRCPKCTSDMLKMEWHAEQEAGHPHILGGLTEYEQEHLTVECVRCGYDWKAAPFAASEVASR